MLKRSRNHFGGFQGVFLTFCHFGRRAYGIKNAARQPFGAGGVVVVRAGRACRQRQSRAVNVSPFKGM